MTQTAPPKHTSDSGANGHSEATAEALDKCLAGASSLLSAAFTLDTIEGSAQRRFSHRKLEYFVSLKEFRIIVFFCSLHQHDLD